MSDAYYVKDYLRPGGTDSDAIDRCFAAANGAQGHRTVVFDGKDFRIDRAICVSSGTQVIVDDCAIRQNDGVFDNIFRGDNLVLNGIDPYGIPLDVTPLSDIRIIGKGGARLIGTGKPRVGYHPFLREYQEMTGDFWGWRTLMISFSCCDGFELAGFRLEQTMCWAVSFDNCQNCHIHDLDIHSHVKNGDGIDFRSGCHHCVVENITGFTSDDTVACTALAIGKAEPVPSKYLSTLEPYNDSRETIDGDISHITVRNIFTGGHHHGVICLAAFGNQVRDINISDIRESGEGDREAAVKIYTGYGNGYKSGDIRDIRIDNVVSNIAKYAVLIQCDAANVTTENIVQNKPDGTPVGRK